MSEPVYEITYRMPRDKHWRYAGDADSFTMMGMLLQAVISKQPACVKMEKKKS